MSTDQAVYWNLVRNNRLKIHIQNSIRHYVTSGTRYKDISNWDTIWSGYVLDLFLLGKFSKNPVAETVQVNKNLIAKISEITLIKPFLVQEILDAALVSITDRIPLLVDQDIRFETGKLFIGDLELDNPTNVSSVEGMRQLMRYELIRGYRHTGNVRINLPDVINVCVNTLEIPGCGLFKDDISTLGLPMDYISTLDEEKTLAVYAPTSLSYTKILISELENYMNRFHNAQIFVVTLHDKLNIRRLKPIKAKGVIVYTNSKLKPSEYLLGEAADFPWSYQFMPSFKEMFSRLQYIADNIDEYMHWSVRRRDYNLGVIERKFPEDYYETDSIADIHAEPVRIMCNEEGHKSPYDVWNELIITNPEILTKTVEEKREAVYQNKGRGCNLFNAAYATYALSRFVGKGSRILDPASGWGERAIASWACECSEYRGWDTNPDLQDVYRQQMEASGLSLNSSVKYGPFEDDAHLFDSGYAGYFDACITSPPFFTQEIYTGQMTSTERYKEFDTWNKNFYTPLLKACYKGLRYGGFMMAYIPAFWTQEGPKAYLSSMKTIADQIMKEQGAVYEGILGFSMYNTLENRKGNVREMFFWSKPFRVLKQIEVKENRILDYSNLPGGIFTLGINFFTKIKYDVYVIVDYPSYDIEFICYACTVKNIKCFVVANEQPPVQFYAARFIQKKGFKAPKKAFVIKKGCNIQELLRMVKAKITLNAKPIRVWAYDSPGMRALVPMLFPDSKVMMVTTRNVKTPEKNFQYIKVNNDNPCKGGFCLYGKANPVFDAKMLSLYDPNDWMIINK